MHSMLIYNTWPCLIIGAKKHDYNYHIAKFDTTLSLILQLNIVNLKKNCKIVGYYINERDGNLIFKESL